ncbi:MAG: flippase-like domain-containing protein [Candidatus Omnitrophica bacterium]|nr:flippase-like domain-containing protein [Candidatus Omnitrophota bacterium]
MKKALKNSLILTLLIISTVFIFYLIFTKIDLIKTIESIKSVKFHYFILCVLISTFINIFVYAKIRLIIWQCLKHIISYKELLFIRLGSMPFKAIPSMKTTDIVAALYLNKFNNIPIAEGILSNIIASIFCLISLLFIFMIGYLSHLLYHIDFSQFQHYFTIMFFISILLVIFLYSFLLNQNIGKNILYNLFFRKESKHLTILQKQI